MHVRAQNISLERPWKTGREHIEQKLLKIWRIKFESQKTIVTAIKKLKANISGTIVFTEKMEFDNFFSTNLQRCLWRGYLWQKSCKNNKYVTKNTKRTERESNPPPHILLWSFHVTTALHSFLLAFLFCCL